VVQAGPYVRSSYLAESMFRGWNKNLTTARLGNIISDESYTD
jgi:thioester reductase-like protein